MEDELKQSFDGLPEGQNGLSIDRQQVVFMLPQCLANQLTFPRQYLIAT
jgi:hypothetical protein